MNRRHPKNPENGVYNFANGKNEGFGIDCKNTHADHPFPNRINRLWTVLLWGGLLLGFAAVLGRCGYLQTQKHSYYESRAQHQQRKIIPQQARRGLILDRNGTVLALSRNVWSVRLDPYLIGTNNRQVADKLGEILDLPADLLCNDIQQRQDKRFMWVKRDITPEQTQKIRDLAIRGVVLEREFKREYPLGKLACHVIGFTDAYGKGLEGLELAYDEQLTGRDGQILLKGDVHRRPIGSLKDTQPSRDGMSIVLSLDVVIQQCLEKELQEVLEKFHAAGATGIVMEPKTGEVLAMANIPYYDPGQVANSSADQRRNRALTDPYEPGSTFKPFTVAAAMAGNYVQLDEKIDCLDRPYRGKGFGMISEYRHPYGVLTVEGILVHSSNVGSAKIAQRMGKPYFYEMIQKFGFGRKTGIDLPGEDIGILRPLQQWNDKDYTLTRVGFGQGIAVTPIQLIRSFCCLASGGSLVKPRVVRGVLGPEGKVLHDYGVCQVSLWQGQSQAGRDDAGRVISEELARTMVQRPLTGAVARKEGSAHKAYLEQWSVFGKTGTAQIAKSDGRGYEENQYISSFIAGAPAEDPRVVVLIIVRRPDRSLGLGYTGGMVAAPAVGQVLRQILTYYSVNL